MIIFIDRQHSGKPNRITDRGASFDLNQDGTISTEEQEAIWTGRIAIELEIILLGMGFRVLPISDGTYSQRHQRVNSYVSQIQDSEYVYLALHLNSGGGDYSSFFHHYSSTKGSSLAKFMANEMEASFPEIKDHRAIKASPSDWTKNAWNTIKGVGKPVAICCEPLFMDTHWKLLKPENIQKIALAMARGIAEWNGND